MLSAVGALCTGVTTIENVTVLFWAFDAESVTVTPKLKVPLKVGIPEMTPPVDNVNPDGRLPEEILHL